MASEVYFADLKARNTGSNKASKIGKLFDRAGFSDLIKKDDLTAVKIHFGEMGGDAFINPIFVRPVVDRIKESGGRPFLTDTNTLYKGSRHNSVDHIETAVLHGFDYAVVGAPIIIADGLTGKNLVNVKMAGKHFGSLRIAGDIHRADSMIVMSHFKGHEMAGFGGAIKNLAMGCATAYGKMDQHSARPKVAAARCIGCGECLDICPVDAPHIEGGKSFIVREKCIGCGECMTVCPADAIGLDWESEIDPFMERMVEYAYGAVDGKRDRCGYINFLLKISPDCDCFSWSDHPIVPDIGILASRDPVAIDRASYDLVNSSQGFLDTKLKKNHEPGKDKFKGMREKTNGYLQITYAEELGMGSSDYDLVRI
ncbi:MAG: DUF362 domain-containing protein [Thermoplasmatota archaeon]